MNVHEKFGPHRKTIKRIVMNEVNKSRKMSHEREIDWQ